VSSEYRREDQVMQAALDGQGVALGRVPLINNLLKQGCLVAPLRGGKCATSRACYVVSATRTALRPEARFFIDWLIEEASADGPGAAPAAVPPTRRGSA
jgi:LysR family glycine cleavage system transcriptional activator